MTGTDPLSSYTRLQEVSKLNTLSKPMYGPAKEVSTDMASSDMATPFRPTNSSKSVKPVNTKANGPTNLPSGNGPDQPTTSSTPKKNLRKLKPINP